MWNPAIRVSWAGACVLLLGLAQLFCAWGQAHYAKAATQTIDWAAPYAALASTEFTDEQLRFFEERVRPVLAEHCYACHSHEAERVKGGVYLDSRAGVIDSFAAEPGDPDNSLMIEAVHYTDPTTQMPPAGKLADEDIAALEQWVAMGLPWPDEAAAGQVEAFDLEARHAAHWCWQPPARTAPPEVRRQGWVRNDIDRYILAKLEEAGLSPAPEADRVTLIRRLTFDLTGLPPTVEEIDAFVADESPDAYEALVDRLLASPHFGEKWGRHWLDLVRYAETLGHEFDFDVFAAWRYRDYVIRSLNADVPYDRFLFEHLAGDLMPEPRIDPATGENQSIQGTGWYWLGEQTHSPVDVKGHQSDVIANQIDVIGRGFQGVTIACARCHDHKFDAIATKDYYALYGIVESTTWMPTPVQPVDELRGDADGLRTARAAAEARLRERWAPDQIELQPYLTAAAEVFGQTRAIEDQGERNRRVAALAAELAQRDGLDADLLHRWAALTYDGALGDGQHPLHGWRVTVHSKPEDMQRWWADQPARSRAVFAAGDAMTLRDGDEVWFDGSDAGDMLTYGLAFGDDENVVPGMLLTAAGRGAGLGQVAVYPGRSSATASNRWQGVLATPARPIQKRYVHVLAQGWGTRLNFVIDGFRVIRAPIYGPMRQGVYAAYPRWFTVDFDKWLEDEHDLFVEMSDLTAHDQGSGGSPADAHGTVYRIIASDHHAPPAPGYTLLGAMEPGDAPTVEQVAAAYEQAARDAVEFWRSGASPQTPVQQAQLALVSVLLDGGLIGLRDAGGDVQDAGELMADYRQAAGRVPVPSLVLAAAEATPRDTPVFVRGSHLVRGDPTPRRYLEALVGQDAQAPDTDSGRLQLAQTITDPGNPLTARVAVNRLWHHLLGRGIVASVDNFGVLGFPPTHPALLDYLALTFMESDGWSSKAMIKRIVMSATYRQTSDRLDTGAELEDPENLLLHRQNLRRLTAESIRDAVLHTSGRLDPAMYGPPVMVHLTSFMEGRGRPGHSGPLDGDGRRSIYTSVRRNFLSPMMLAFDAPAPFSTVGRRNVTNVPAQALFLMNDPMIHEQAGRWAQQLVAADDASAAARVERVWRRALGRPPEPAEAEAALAYLQAQASGYGLSDEALMHDARPWADLCHAVFNTKSFIYVR